MNEVTARRSHTIALTALCMLAALCLLWEWLLAPVRPGGSWMVLKALPLLIPLPGILSSSPRRRYTYQWSTLFIWLYFTEGVVRAWSDISTVSQTLAAIQVVLCMAFFIAAVGYVRNTPSHLAKS
ncbi:MAG: DUF2069 domain-containing protein [Burkholderiales bacterium]